ncbi:MULTISPECIES: hypothetical protein [unclassified Stenotrophomonas]|uniref:hypothetical protein n=1 Tax=unclassified Stenotrophomonas TaxID=196198 RepID=UPI0028A6F6E2|nr:hypothetical protein [Stenotrophomonas sp.]
MQRMITEQVPIIPCSKGHAARHMLDLRRPSAGGGHSVECACTSTARHLTFEEAHAEWNLVHGQRAPRRKTPAKRSVFPSELAQMPLAL